MADNRTMAQMLQAPIEGYEDAIVVPPINANNFELKQPLINLVQSNKFTGRQDPHNHLRFFNKVTSTFRHPEVPNTSIKLLLFPFSLNGEARDWLDKEPPSTDISKITRKTVKNGQARTRESEEYKKKPKNQSRSQKYQASVKSNTVMSDSKDSTVTYTVVSSPFADLPDIGSPGVDGPPVMPEDPYAYVVAAFQAPPSPDYVSGPEYPPSPEFVPEPVYPEFMPLEDEILPAEEQPLPAAISPTADSPGYVPESDPEEDDDEDLEEDPADYPADGGDDGDDENESFDDDEDEDIDIEGDEEEEEHPAPADSTVVALPAVD
ncbi:hypothetical protein Tco_1501414 [Tanacetum coccineum]